MSKSRALFIIAAPLAALFIAISCSGPSNPENNTPTPGSKHTGLGLLLSVADTVYDHHFLAYLSEHSSVAIYDSVEYDYTLPSRQITRAWVSNGGSVTFDGSVLSSQGTDTFSYDGDLSNLKTDGTNQSFKVVGNSGFPQDTLWVTAPSPVNAVAVSSPSFKDTITKTNGMTVTWSSASGSQSVLIVVSPVSDTTGVISVETTDSGSYTFSAAALSNLGDGLHDILLARGQVTTGIAPDSTRYLGALFTQHSITVVLD